MTRHSLLLPCQLLARLWQPYADAARFTRLALAEAWSERDRDVSLWRRYGPAAAIAALLVLGVASRERDPDAAPTTESTVPASADPLPALLSSTMPSPIVVASVAPAAAPAPVEEPRSWALLDFAEQRLKALEHRLDLSESERGRLEGEFQRLQSDVARRKLEIAERERQLADIVANQSAALGRLAEQTTASVEALSKLVARTGIDPERLIAAVRRETGAGGPYIQLAENHLVAPDVVTPGFGGPMIRLEALRRALTALPLESPLGEAVVMSPYGIRRDPFNGQAAMHHGLDLLAPARSPVLATAAGIVAHAGWQGEYGNLVELDHGFGIRTRYAHLSRVDVKAGDAVGLRAQLGLLGSTGRSTGPHVHYEVLFEGDSLDPIRFIEARRYALRGVRGVRGGRL